MSDATPPATARERLAIAGATAAFVAWCLGFVARTSFVLEGRRYFCLFDDAMISMTYARNLVAGHGLRWTSAGAPVEGFSHPLWLLAMAPAQLLGPLAWRALVVQGLSIALLVAHLFLIRALARRHFAFSAAPSWIPAVLLTAGCYALSYWSLVGMETGLQAVLVALAVLLALDIAASGRDRHLALWATLAAAYLLRMDMAILALVVEGYLAVESRGALLRSRSWRVGLALFVATVLGYEVFRWAYFGDLLPNTYYLKLTGVPLGIRWLAGAASLGRFVRAHALLLISTALLAAPVIRRDRRAALPAMIFLAFCAYDVHVGGDAWELGTPIRANRFLAFVLPMVFLLAGAGISLALGSRRRGAPARSRWALAGASCGLVLAAEGLPDLGALTSQARLFALTEAPPASESGARMLARLRAAERALRPGARVAVTWAGIPAFFGDFDWVDIYGYNDRRVARGPSAIPLDRTNYRLFRPGHMKWDLARLLGVERPDAILPDSDESHPAPPPPNYFARDGIWVRADSAYLRRRRRRRGHARADRPRGERFRSG